MTASNSPPRGSAVFLETDLTMGFASDARQLIARAIKRASAGFSASFSALMADVTFASNNA
ncbi:hypothetical protein D3C86_2124960 [compost metagenome]